MLGYNTDRTAYQSIYMSKLLVTSVSRGREELQLLSSQHDTACKHS
jgi:hypothetical protein